MEKELSYPKEKVRIVLIEKIHEAAAQTFSDAGYHVELIPNALEGEPLRHAIKDAHIVGVRSRTKLRADDIEAARRLLAVGCFTVGTDQVSLTDSATRGIPVFNAPHSSTRSVAELTIGNIVSLARRVCDKNTKMHAGVWDKSLSHAEEIRGKKLGIVGYGHIGQQVSILAEAFGMEVYFFDILKKLPLGRAKALGSLEELLRTAQFLTLHVPGTTKTKNMIGAQELALLSRGSYLLNLSRGNVVDIPALRDSLQNGHIAGAALDVFPSEPGPTEAPFENPLQGCANVILTPHVGGNTEEAQRNIGAEVARAIINFIDSGSTEGAVNFPAVVLPSLPDAHRILNIHKNVPGALAQINRIVSEVGANIEAQQLSTLGEIGYLVMDINRDLSDEVKRQIENLPFSIRTRILY